MKKEEAEPPRPLSGPPSDSLIGKILQDRFEVVEKLAAGGMGVVYRAIQQPLGRQVALKVLTTSADAERDRDFNRRFFREAAAVAKLSHPNTVVVHDYGRADDGTLFIAMEFIEGITFGRHLRLNGPFTPCAALRLSQQICGSLRNAHAAGLVHRDIKPGNVMLTPQPTMPLFCKVLDFGLVKVADTPADELTRDGVIMGSPRYMAPEQVLSGKIDARTDIYAFGALLHHMLTGAAPFVAETDFDVLASQVQKLPPALTETNPACDAGPVFNELVLRCLQKEKEDRFQSMDEVIEGLRACEQDLVVRGLLHDTSPSLNSSGLLHLPISGTTGDFPAAVSSGSGSIPDEISRDFDPSSDNSWADAQPPRSKRPLALLALAGLVLIGGLGFYLSRASEGAPSLPPAAAEPTPPETAQTALEEIAPVRVTLNSQPSGATARVDGRDFGDTPLHLEIPTGEEWTVTLTMAGYESREIVVDSHRELVDIRLSAVAPVATEVPEAVEPTRTARRGQRGRSARSAAPLATPPESEPVPAPPVAARRQVDSQHNSDIDDPWAD